MQIRLLSHWLCASAIVACAGTPSERGEEHATVQMQALTDSSSEEEFRDYFQDLGADSVWNEIIGLNSSF